MLDGGWAPLALRRKATESLGSSLRSVEAVVVNIARRATVRLGVLSVRRVLARLDPLSLAVDVGQVQPSRRRVLHPRGHLVGDVVVGVDPGLPLERSHAVPGEEIIVASTAVTLVH